MTLRELAAVTKAVAPEPSKLGGEALAELMRRYPDV
jgi:hypothetical protein